MLVCFSDHFCPTPLLAQTASWPPSFDQTVFCPNLCESSLKTLANGAALRDNLLLMSCFLGHGTQCDGVGVSLLCCGASVRCVFKIFVGASNIWEVPDSLPLDPSSDTTPSAGQPSAGPPLRWTAQNFALFFLSRHYFHSFFLSWWSFRGIGGVIEFRDPQMHAHAAKPTPHFDRPSGERTGDWSVRHTVHVGIVRDRDSCQVMCRGPGSFALSCRSWCQRCVARRSNGTGFHSGAPLVPHSRS